MPLTFSSGYGGLARLPDFVYVEGIPNERAGEEHLL